MPRKRMFKNAIRICTVFPSGEVETIEEQAEKNGMNRSQLIRDAVSGVLPKVDDIGGIEDIEK